MLWLHESFLVNVIVRRRRLLVVRLLVCLPQVDAEKHAQADDQDQTDAAAKEREKCPLPIVRQLHGYRKQVVRLYQLRHSTPECCHFKFYLKK